MGPSPADPGGVSDISVKAVLKKDPTERLMLGLSSGKREDKSFSH